MQNKIKKLFSAIALSTALGLISKPTIAEETKAEKPLVQIAILLDTSGSMNGVIEQAKIQLWNIVNQFISSDRDGVRPELQVALYQYGSPSLGAENGYIKQLAPLTVDLDKISTELFNLRTSGGEEYCGWAIKNATEELEWSENPNDYKAIFIAGNESFSQGPVNFREACKNAIKKGIIVNTIHCFGAGNEFWEEAALLADGKYISIDHNRRVVEVSTPYDEEISNLNQQLNATYIAFGDHGAQRLARQGMNDTSSAKISSANVAERAISKASAFYVNSDWDLVDAVNQNNTDLGTIERKQLPEELRDKSNEEIAEIVKEKSLEREKIQTEIQELAKKRANFISQKQQELAGNEETFGNQIISIVNEQAAGRGFSFNNK